MLPSGSLDILPSRKTLSVGKVINWSGPATAIGGLMVSLHPSHDFSFLQESIPVSKDNTGNKSNTIFFMSEPFISNSPATNE